jgi:hypothetical protein
VTLDTAGVAEYRNEASTATGSLFEVEMVVVGQVMYSGAFTICNVQATCPFKLRLAAPADGTTEALFGAASAGSGSLTRATVQVLFTRADFLSLSSLSHRAVWGRRSFFS